MYAIRSYYASDSWFQKGTDFFGANGCRLARYHHEQRSFTPFLMRHRNSSRLGHPGMRHNGVFQIDGADPLAAGFDQIFAAINELDMAIGIDARDITGAKPTILVSDNFV